MSVPSYDDIQADLRKMLAALPSAEDSLFGITAGEYAKAIGPPPGTDPYRALFDYIAKRDMGEFRDAGDGMVRLMLEGALGVKDGKVDGLDYAYVSGGVARLTDPENGKCLYCCAVITKDGKIAPALAIEPMPEEWVGMDGVRYPA